MKLKLLNGEAGRLFAPVTWLGKIDSNTLCIVAMIISLLAFVVSLWPDEVARWLAARLAKPPIPAVQQTTPQPPRQ